MTQAMVKMVTRTVEFRARVTRMGEKLHIIIPKPYHNDFEKQKMVDEFVDIKASITDYGDKIKESGVSKK
jgi:hypothetical protein